MAELETIILSIVAMLAGIMFSAFVGFVCWIIREFIKREIAAARFALRLDTQSHRTQVKTQLSQLREEVLAKFDESKQNVRGEAVQPDAERNKPPLWDDIEQIREAKAKLMSGIEGDADKEFSQMSDLDKWRALDARELELQGVDFDPRLASN